jgi:hypothetical protein
MGSLRIAIKEGLLSKETHRMLVYVIGYIAWQHRIAPSGADLEGAIYENIERKIYRDVKRLLRRKGLDKFLEVSYEE